MADEVVSIYDLDISKALDKFDVLDSKYSDLDAVQKKVAATDPFKGKAESAEAFDDAIRKNTTSFVASTASAKALEEELMKLSNVKKDLIQRQKEYVAGANYDKITVELKQVNKEIDDINKGLKQAQVSGGKFGGILSQLKQGFSGLKDSIVSKGGFGGALEGILTRLTGPLGLVAAGIAFVTVKTIQANKEFKEMNDRLLGVLGSQAAVTKDMDILDSIADELKITLKDMNVAYGTLVVNGISPTKAGMKSLGEFAKELKTDMVTLSNAIVDSDKGTLESIRKLGVQAQKDGDKIKLSFRGVNTEFVKGSGESVNALVKIADKIEMVQKDSDKLGNFNVAEKIAKGWQDLGNQMESSGTKVNDITFPAFERLILLLNGGRKSVLSFSESFGVWLHGSFQQVINDLSLLSSYLLYLPDLVKNGAMQADINLKVALSKFKSNREEINKMYNDALNGVGSEASGELTGGDKLEDEEARKRREEKARQRAEARKRALLKAEEDLRKALLKLESEFGKEKLQLLRDNELAYLDAKKILDLKEIEEERKTFLKIKQLAAGASKGKFDSKNNPIADKSIGLSQAENNIFEARAGIVNDDAYKRRAEYIVEIEQKLNMALANEYQAGLQNIEKKYQDLYKLADQDGRSRLALEKKKQKEIDQLTLDSQIRKIDLLSEKDSNTSELAIIDAQIKGRIDLELAATQQLLQIQKDYLKEKLKLLEASSDPEAALIASGIKKAIAELDLAQSDLSKKTKEISNIFGSDFWLRAIGVSDNDIQSVKEGFSQIRDNIMEAYALQIQLTQNRIDRIETELDKKKDQIKTEQELNKKGFANNLSLREKEYAELKSQREKAIEDQRRLQKIQLTIDTAIQASSMITAASKVFSAFASIPVVGVPLAIAAVALMMGSFVAAKAKAFQLVNEGSPDKYKDGGRVRGRLHSEGGTLIEAERDEFVASRKATAKYGDLLEDINNDNEAGIMDFLLRNLLSGTGVSAAEKHRNDTVQHIQDYNHALNDFDDSQVLNEILERLESIEKGTNRIPESQLVGLGEGKYLEKSPTGTIVRDLSLFP